MQLTMVQSRLPKSFRCTDILVNMSRGSTDRIIDNDLPIAQTESNGGIVAVTEIN